MLGVSTALLTTSRSHAGSASVSGEAQPRGARRARSLRRVLVVSDAELRDRSPGTVSDSERLAAYAHRFSTNRDRSVR